MPRKGAAEEDDFRPGYKARAAKAEAAAAKASVSVLIRIFGILLSCEELAKNFALCFPSNAIDEHTISWFLLHTLSTCYISYFYNSYSWQFLHYLSCCLSTNSPYPIFCLFQLQKAKEEADEAAKWQDGANARGAKRWGTISWNHWHVLCTGFVRDIHFFIFPSDNDTHIPEFLTYRAAEQALKQAEKEAARKQKEDLLRQEEAIFGKSEKAKNRVAGKVASRHEERVSKDAIAFERYHAPELQARGIDAALAVMTIATQESGQSGDIAADMAAAEKIIRQQQTGVNVDDEHPEKRMKAAFERFKVRELPILREEFPRLRLSQYLEMVRKKWDKSPENPMYAAKLAKEKAEAEAKRTKDW